MRILVTGGQGFFGSHVGRELRLAGHFAYPIRHSDYDLRVREECHQALVDTQPDVVVHLAAAVGGIESNRKNPGRFLYDNAVMGVELMEQSRLHGVAKFVTIGTACEYPAHSPMPLREDDIWNGYPAKVTAPYGIAKRLLLEQGQAYRGQYGLNVIHLIPTNLYGPGDNFDPETSHVVAGMIRKFSEAVRGSKDAVECWGSGTTTREFLYVEDAAAAIVRATEHYDDAEPVNIGTGIETPVAKLAQMLADLYGFEGAITWSQARPDGNPRRWMDISRANERFGFTATTSLAQGLKETVEWYEAKDD